ncbi:hypothetical protein FZEAL_154 [Fusarium zealandicum]|uniref:Uncharacterized protein n=1 Tax=Fusarium zealandicum TaxID=1053134 RepID=A0A8H4UVB2_9HYPO|nr:hypothetical protein FZEAL_154 [Fusarium zealandicum]
MMDPSSHHLLNSTSSLWTGETTCPSTLRARLRDDDTPATSSSAKPAPYRDVYQQVQACLGNHLLAPKRSKTRASVPESNEPAAQLREAFARMGMALHASAFEQLIQAHTQVQSRIMRFSSESAATLTQCNALYSNIAYPLSATLCYSDDFSRATIATHLGNLNKDIAKAKEELDRLSEEWDACYQDEVDAWKAMNEQLDDNRGPATSDEEAVKMAHKFKAEAEDIVKAKCRLLGEVEKEFKADIQAETLRMIQNFFVDD